METSYDHWIGQTALDADGDKVGKITDVFYDDVTERPEWVKVKTGLLGGARFVPIAGAEVIAHTDDPDDCDLRLAYRTDMIKDAPKVDDDEHDAVRDDDDHHLTAAQERELYEHYGFNYDERTATGTYGRDYGKLRPDVNYPFAKPATVVGAVRLRRYESSQQDA